jgi:hypothetical protein
MQPADVMTAYTGPRPSPAKRWAPALVTLMAIDAVANVVAFGLNLVERHNLERAKSGNPVSRAFLDDTLSTIRALGRISLVVTIGVAIVGVVWSHKRRAPSRKNLGGESAVEPSLHNVSRALNTTFWVMLALAFLATRIAASTQHLGMTADDFIRYRTYLAASDLFRAVMWGSFAALVVKANKLQERRELAPPLPPPLPTTG